MRAWWWVAVLTGCSQNVSFSLPSEELLGVVVYENGAPIQQCEIPAGSAKQKALAHWLQQNTGDWSATPATYVPGVLVAGNDFSINFLGNSVILNYAGGQYAHKVNPNEYEYLRCLPGTQQKAPPDAG